MKVTYAAGGPQGQAPPAGALVGQQPPATPQNDPQRAAQLDELVQQILGGEIPGEGYLQPQAPDKLPEPIGTTPERVRGRLLRAIETCAASVAMPFGADKKSDLGKAILEISQSYLLLDPSLDENGVPVEGPGSQAHAAAAAQAAFPVPGEGARKTVTHPKAEPNAAEEALNDRTKSMQKDLAGARGQTPRPTPHVGGA